MDRFQETKTAIIERLRQLNAEPSTLVSLYDLGTALVPAGFTEHELADVLFSLEDDKVIELIEGNRLRLVGVT